jgi:putative ABC transport system permease protein
MFNYYFGLALRSLRRNVVLTALMVAVIGVGIGASMTVLTIYRAMTGDPIPQKSDRLFVPQIDNWGPDMEERPANSDGLPEQLSYTDASALIAAHAGRQTAMYSTILPLTPPNPQLLPFTVHVRATYADFFAMFQVPFKYGGPWNTTDDHSHSAMAVITRELNDKVFGGANSVGRILHLGGDDYRVSGVLDDWKPTPRFFDLADNRFGKTEDVLLPFTRAIDKQMTVWGNDYCNGNVGTGWAGYLRSNCVWIQFWVELPNASEVASYRAFLNSYAAEQRRNGRFHWAPRTRLRNERQWLSYEQVVPPQVHVMAIVSFSFLFVCLVNAMGLMLAKMLGSAADIGVRRALGATRPAILAQCLIEAGVIGIAGGLVGLLLTGLGLVGVRSLFTQQFIDLAHLDLPDLGICMLLAVLSAIIAGLYPTWRATQMQPALQLKAQ